MRYECHVTCDLKDAGKAESVVRKRQDHWHTSQIDRDPVLGEDTHFYLTAHDAHYGDLFGRMKRLKAELVEVGVEVLRMKIEEVVYDSRRVGAPRGLYL